MRKAIFITVRSASSRLPEKCYLPIKGKPTIQYVIEQAKKSKLADIIVLCTTRNKEDDELCKIAIKNSITYSRGSETDKLERWNSAAKKYNIEFLLLRMAMIFFVQMNFLILLLNNMKKQRLTLLKVKILFVVLLHMV